FVRSQGEVVRVVAPQLLERLRAKFLDPPRIPRSSRPHADQFPRHDVQPVESLENLRAALHHKDKPRIVDLRLHTSSERQWYGFVRLAESDSASFTGRQHVVPSFPRSKHLSRSRADEPPGRTTLGLHPGRDAKLVALAESIFPPCASMTNKGILGKL